MNFPKLSTEIGVKNGPGFDLPNNVGVCLHDFVYTIYISIQTTLFIDIQNCGYNLS